MLGKTLFFFLVWLVVGCAKPTYLNPKPNGNLGNQNISTACDLQFSNSKICIAWKWEALPTSTTFGSFLFRLYKLDETDGFPILITPEVEPSVLLWMPSMGHGSSPTLVKEVSVGTYKVNNVFFTMPGDWEIHFQLKKENLDEAVVNFHF